MNPVLLVEDDRSLGATLRDCLNREGYSVTWTQSKAGALQSLRENRYDLCVLDVGLPDGSGFELAETLKGLQQGPILFLTAQSDAESRLRGYELGAEEFVPKPFHLRELLLRVKHVLENHRPRQHWTVGDLEFDFDGLKILRKGLNQNVAVKDVRLLQLLLDSSPRVVSRDQALNLIWGEDQFPSNRTVDNAILRLRSVLGVENESHIESVRGIGYRWSKEGSVI